MDGIAVIVNPKNTFESLTTASVKEIYIGNFVSWNDITE
jgi:ABC-type phosphate transport system substrate-binding protein